MSNPFKTSPIHTTIKDGDYAELAVCWDSDTNLNDPKAWHTILHYTYKDPELGNDYHHIDLSPEEAKKLHKWLGKFLEKVGS